MNWSYILLRLALLLATALALEHAIKTGRIKPVTDPRKIRIIGAVLVCTGLFLIAFTGLLIAFTIDNIIAGTSLAARTSEASSIKAECLALAQELRQLRERLQTADPSQYKDLAKELENLATRADALLERYRAFKEKVSGDTSLVEQERIFLDGLKIVQRHLEEGKLDDLDPYWLTVAELTIETIR